MWICTIPQYSKIRGTNSIRIISFQDPLNESFTNTILKSLLERSLAKQILKGSFESPQKSINQWCLGSSWNGVISNWCPVSLLLFVFFSHQNSVSVVWSSTTPWNKTRWTMTSKKITEIWETKFHLRSPVSLLLAFNFHGSSKPISIGRFGRFGCILVRQMKSLVR